MALYHGIQAIITFLLNNPLYSEFVECRYPSSVKISICNFHSQGQVPGQVQVQVCCLAGEARQVQVQAGTGAGMLSGRRGEAGETRQARQV